MCLFSTTHLYEVFFLCLLQQWTMTIVDRSTEKSDHESVGGKQSPFSSGDIRMDSSCSSSWTVGPTKPSDSLRLKSPGCLGSASGAAVFNTTPSCVDRPKEQGGQVSPLSHSISCMKVFTTSARRPKWATESSLVFLHYHLFSVCVVLFHTFYFKSHSDIIIKNMINHKGFWSNCSSVWIALFSS